MDLGDELHLRRKEISEILMGLCQRSRSVTLNGASCYETLGSFKKLLTQDPNPGCSKPQCLMGKGPRKEIFQNLSK